METFHKSVLLKEVIEFLNVRVGGKYIDATIGGGGHTKAILEHGGIVLGIDQDLKAIEYLEEKFKIQNLKFKIGRELVLVHGNFRDIREIAQKYGFEEVEGILFDLGVSSYQLEHSGRGFSFLKDEPLDMRVYPTTASGQLTAAEIVNTWRKEELYELFSKLGEETNSSPIVDGIISARQVKPIETSRELAKIIEGIALRLAQGKRGKLHPATKVFMALRLAVNNELENLRKGLEGGAKLIVARGRMVVISFHSLEDRVIKNMFRGWEQTGQAELLTKKPIQATHEEIRTNPRARSAKLRAIERIIKNSQLR